MNVCTCVRKVQKAENIISSPLSFHKQAVLPGPCVIRPTTKHTKELHIAWEREERTDFRNNWTVVHNIHTTRHKNLLYTMIW